MKLQLTFLVATLVLTALATGCSMPPDNGRGDDWGPTRGPVSNTSKDLDQPRAPSQSKDDVSNPSRW